MYKPLILPLLLLLLCGHGYAQLTGPGYPVPDTFIQHKRFWRASGELFLTELAPWSYNYFIRKADFAKITFKSIGTNLKPSSWEWDDNNFKTNQYAHPYHGNLYFNSFRTNGYTFWQSAPAAFAGSFLWEVAGETHYPAPNDFVNTSLGGIALGEMTYRISNSIINNRAYGFKRQAQEVAALLINPVNGLNRILDGRWGRIHVGPEDTGKARIRFQLDLGSRRFSEREEDIFEKGHNEAYLRLRLQYGEPYTASRKPFQFFFLQVEAGASDSAYLNTVQVYGNLSQWNLKTKGQHTLLGAITMNYDYFYNTSFEYGAQSFNFRVNAGFNRQRHTRYYAHAGAGVIALAAVQNKYLYFGEGRDYDFGSGASILAGGSLIYRDKLYCLLSYRGGWFYTLNGSRSSYFLNAASLETRYLFGSHISLGLEFGHFSVTGYYTDFDNVYRRYPFVRYSVGYLL